MQARQADLHTLFQSGGRAFPETVWPILNLLAAQAGHLTPAQCRTIMAQMDISLEGLMVRLLPLAGAYARVPVSRFVVGAVIQAQSGDDPQDYGLYLGANLELAGQSLDTAVHAEQAAVVNACHQGAGTVRTLAVSAAPCGYCRQFLNELADAERMEVIISPGINQQEDLRLGLRELLPHAFGPRDLNQPAGFMAPGRKPIPLQLKESAVDELVLGALSAATDTYAPYTGNAAGCAVRTREGQVFFGRYVESAAFNPSIGPLTAALINLNMARAAAPLDLTRVVLVERPTTISQRGAVEKMASSLGKGLKLEYHEARPA